MWFGKKAAANGKAAEPPDHAGVEQRFDDAECGFWRSIDEGVLHFQ